MMKTKRRERIEDLLLRGGIIRREPADEYSLWHPSITRTYTLKLKEEEVMELLDEGSLITVAWQWWALRPDLVAMRCARKFFNKVSTQH